MLALREVMGIHYQKGVLIDPEGLIAIQGANEDNQPLAVKHTQTKCNWAQ